MILTKDCYRSPHLAHQECTSSGAALLQGQRSVCMLHGINLWPVTVLGQGKEKKPTMEWGRPPAVQGSEDRKQVLPALVSCQDEAGPLTSSWLQRRNSIRGRTSCKKSEFKQLSFCGMYDKEGTLFPPAFWPVPSSSEYDQCWGVAFSCTLSVEGIGSCISQFPAFVVLEAMGYFSMNAAYGEKCKHAVGNCTADTWKGNVCCLKKAHEMTSMCLYAWIVVRRC